MRQPVLMLVGCDIDFLAWIPCFYRSYVILHQIWMINITAQQWEIKVVAFLQGNTENTHENTTPENTEYFRSEYSVLLFWEIKQISALLFVK